MKINVRTLLYGVICVLVTLAMLFSFWQIESSLPLYEISFIVMFFWYITLINDLVKRNKYINILVVFSMAILLIYMIPLLNGNMPIQAFTFIMNFVFMHVGIRYEVKKDALNVFLYMAIVNVLGLLYAFFTTADYWWYTSSLTIGDFNPQAIGTWAYILIAALLLFVDYFDISYRGKIIIIGLIIALIYITIATNSRAAMFVSMLIVVLRFLPMYRFFKSKIVAVIVTCIPVLISVVSIALYNWGWFSNLIGSSLLNGRESLWIYHYGLSFKHPLLGNYYQLGEVYTHNIFVDHVVLFGYPFAIVFIIMMSIMLINYQKNMYTRLQYTALTVFIGAVILASNEGMIFSTGCGGCFVYVYSFLYVGNSRIPINKEQKIGVNECR